MKSKITLRTMAVLLAVCMAISGTAVFAAFEDYPDAAGHWAEEHLRRAVDEGLLNGFEDGALRPDAKINYAQALKIICCVLNPINAETYSDLGLNGSEWYAEYAAKAAALGIYFDTDRLEDALTRSEAFVLLADAFQLVSAEPDASVLSGYHDYGSIPASARGAFAALVSGGYVEGFAGYLDPTAAVTRAEFITVLYRIVANVGDGAEPYETDGGLVLTGKAVINNKRFKDPLWLDCLAEDVTLNSVTAGTVVFRSQSSQLTIGNNNSIERLVIAGGNTGSFKLAPSSSSIETLVIGDGAPDKVTVTGKVKRIELMGSGVSLILSSDVDSLVIAGDDCDVVVSSTVKNVSLANGSNNNTVTLDAVSDELLVGGFGNNVTVTSELSRAEISGKDCKLKGNVTAKTLVLNSRGNEYDVRYSELIDNLDYGLTDAVLKLSAPGKLPLEQELVVTAAVTNPYIRDCLAVWTIDGEEVKRETVTVGPEEKTFSLNYKFEYTATMAETSEVSFTLTYESDDGETTSASDKKTVAVENHSPEYYYGDALNTVTSSYAGNYTLAWAQSHDYSDQIKTAWVNGKGYSSSTEYLVWINRTYQRVNVFQGSQENWKLIKTFLCGTGSDVTPTPVGVYTVFGRSASGWTTATYNVRPVVNFKVGSGYAFHSRLYNPGHTYITDPSIGFPVSHGCIRMYDEDVQWIYNNIPTNTTVVVH